MDKNKKIYFYIFRVRRLSFTVRTGIYHEYGYKYYDQTKHFEVFQSINECIDT